MAYFKCDFISYTLKRAVLINIAIPSLQGHEIEQSKGKITHNERVSKDADLLILLHGKSGDHNAWFSYSNAELYAEVNNIAIVTCGVENSMYLDWSDLNPGLDSNDFYRFINEEIQDFVCSNFPVSRDPKHTYIAGLSMGGYGTILHGFTNPEKYRAIGIFSPADFIGDLYTKDHYNQAIKNKYSPRYLIEKAIKENKIFPEIYYSFGTKDFLIDTLRDFKNLLDSFDLKYKFEELEEYGHSWDFWDIQLKQFIEWIPRD